MNPIVTPDMLPIVTALKRRADLGVADGTDASLPYIGFCTALHPSGVQLVFTRDIGHHSSGWLKNPDYERCFHLSISMWDLNARIPRPFEPKVAMLWVDLFYGPAKRFAWEESAKSPQGIAKGVRHYRVFCDEHWRPIKPRGEVYSTEFTEKGWKSWSEVQAHGLTPVMETAS
jgi:hypothetical protein